MANYFISYGDKRCEVSLWRIARQAKYTGLFEHIIKYTPKDLPYYIKSSPLFTFDRGGGYWSWKPWIIYHTLQQCRDNDVVWYADAGCSLVNDSPEWSQLSELIKNHGAIFFQYREGVDYNWASKCRYPENNHPAIKHWTKPSVLQYFSTFIDDGFKDYNKISCGFMLFRKVKNHPSLILNDWLHITLFHPELLSDPFGQDLTHVPREYAAHRHDQSIVTPLVYHYRYADDAIVLKETYESRVGCPCVIATRWRRGPWLLYIKMLVWNVIHRKSFSLKI